MSAKIAAPLDEVPPPPSDPAMEDILASIRKILSDDDAPDALAGNVARSPEDNQAVADLMTSAAQSAGALAAVALTSTQPEPAASIPAPGTTPEPLALTQEMMVSAPNAPAQVTPIGSAASMLNASAAAATAASVGELIRAVSADRTVGVSRSGMTLEDIVREEMRPMIKDWLDRHLPGMVERLVRAVIERVVSRAMT